MTCVRLAGIFTSIAVIASAVVASNIELVGQQKLQVERLDQLANQKLLEIDSQTIFDEGRSISELSDDRATSNHSGHPAPENTSIDGELKEQSSSIEIHKFQGRGDDDKHVKPSPLHHDNADHGPGSDELDEAEDADAEQGILGIPVSQNSDARDGSLTNGRGLKKKSKMRSFSDSSDPRRDGEPDLSIHKTKSDSSTPASFISLNWFWNLFTTNHSNSSEPQQNREKSEVTTTVPEDKALEVKSLIPGVFSNEHPTEPVDAAPPTPETIHYSFLGFNLIDSAGIEGN